MISKKTITEFVKSFDLDKLEGEITVVSKLLLEYNENLRFDHPEYDQFYIQMNQGYDLEVGVVGTRLETDEEFAERCKDIKRQQKLQREKKKLKRDKEREEYERLKRKFEK